MKNIKIPKLAKIAKEASPPSAGYGIDVSSSNLFMNASNLLVGALRGVHQLTEMSLNTPNHQKAAQLDRDIEEKLTKVYKFIESQERKFKGR